MSATWIYSPTDISALYEYLEFCHYQPPRFGLVQGGVSLWGSRLWTGSLRLTYKNVRLEISIPDAEGQASKRDAKSLLANRGMKALRDAEKCYRARLAERSPERRVRQTTCEPDAAIRCVGSSMPNDVMDRRVIEFMQQADDTAKEQRQRRNPGNVGEIHAADRRLMHDSPPKERKSATPGSKPPHYGHGHVQRTTRSSSPTVARSPRGKAFNPPTSSAHIAHLSSIGQILNLTPIYSTYPDNRLFGGTLSFAGCRFSCTATHATRKSAKAELVRRALRYLLKHKERLVREASVGGRDLERVLWSLSRVEEKVAEEGGAGADRRIKDKVGGMLFQTEQERVPARMYTTSRQVPPGRERCGEGDGI